MSKKFIGLIAGTSGDSLTINFKSLGYKVFLIAGRENEPGTDLADGVLITDLGETDEIIEFLKLNGVEIVIFGTGHFKAIELLPKLELNGFVTNLDLGKYNLVKDKVAFKKLISSFDFITPHFTVIKNHDDLKVAQDRLYFPCVVKSAIDVVQPVKVFDSARFNEVCLDILSKNSQVLVEEFIDGSDCTVAVTNVSGEVEDYGVIYYSKAKEYILEGFSEANANKLCLDVEEAIRSTSRKLIKFIKIPGLVRVDFIVKDNKAYILEVNAVMVTGYNGSAFPFFKEVGLDVSKIMSSSALAICQDKLVK